MRSFIICILILASLHAVHAATIQGSVYDYDLTPLTSVVIRINTTPEQAYVAKEGAYAFEVGNGNYAITAEHPKRSLTAEENITVAKEGSYTLDLILFPRFDDNLMDEEIEISDIDLEYNGKSYFSYWMTLVIFIVFGAAILVYSARRKPKHEGLDEEAKRVMDFISEKGGRVSQIDIRKHFPYSEAKISLIVSDLERKHYLEKFKKGKGNVIVIKENRR